ncbi:response regulator transcription factor [Paenibacillus sinopodophylli]|uniref:response regulator transcription factor n=1 Tax=Paenibacillus sinopodophylli TaxID=1837342 RepID=UPI00110CFA79|nr:response regulator [Paenibacillus sinopodophylli]
MNDLIKIMLVDDEPLALENVEEMVPWLEYGFEISARATSGKMALRLFEQYRPDIVITDISMSPMDGLELGKRIYAISPATRIVFLTAYRDFDYARQAIEMRAAYYLLKHEISRNRLLEQLLILRSEIEVDKQEKRSINRQQIKALLSGNRLEGGYGADGFPADSAAAEQLVTGGQAAILYFEKKPVMQMEGSRSAGRSGEPEWWEALGGLLQKEFEQLQQVFVMEMDNAGYVAMLKLTSPNSALILQYTLQQISLSLHRIIQHELGWTTKIMIATISSREQIHQQYTSMLQAYDYSFFLPDRTTFLFDHVQAAAKTRQAQPVDLAIAEADGYELEQFSSLKRNLLVIVERSDLSALRATVRMAAERWIVKDSAITGQIVLGDNARDIVLELYRLAEERHDERRRNDCYSRWVLKAMDYVKQHYADPDLALEMVAEHLQISAVHLRTTFKKETGQSLLDFTTALRMMEAKKLLAVGELKIYEVSQRVGYNTSQYFSQVFKKNTGLHPKEFTGSEANR